MRISIRNRIYWSFLILVSLFVINGLITIITLNKSKKLSDYISSVIDPSQQSLSDFRSLLIESKMYATNWVFLRSNLEDKQALQQLHKVQYPELKLRLVNLFAKLNNRPMTDSLQRVFKECDLLLATETDIMKSLKNFSDYDDPVIKLMNEQMIEDEIIPRTNEVLNLLEHIALNGRKVKIKEYRNQELYSSRLRILILILSVTIVLAGIFLSSYLTVIITRPINNIISIVNDLGKGRLTKANLTKNSDEIGYMVRAVNDLSDKLKETAKFASETGKQNFSAEFKPLSDDDVLGKALLTMRDNLKVSEEELLQTAVTLIQRNKELEQFTYIISHNLRLPVANIMGLYQLLCMEEDDEQEVKKLISNLGTSVHKLDDVIRDLNHTLEVKQQVHEQMEEISLTKLMEDIQQTFNLYIKDDIVEFKWDFSSVDNLYSLKTYLSSIFYNMISNSIKFKRLEEKLLLKITSYNKNDKIIINFKDNGKGIDLGLNGDKLFGLYRRFDTSVEGKGMGLFMVKTQVETLGGKIDVESKINCGTTFSIELPRNT
jgi:signal transduction histidine kinase